MAYCHRLALVQPEVDPFDPPTPKTHPTHSFIRSFIHSFIHSFPGTKHMKWIGRPLRRYGHSKFSKGLIKQEITPFEPPKTLPRTKRKVDRMTHGGDIAGYYTLYMHISAIFLIPAEVLVTDSELLTPISYSSLIVAMALSGLVFKIWAFDRQTTDERRHCSRCPTCYYRQAT